MLVATVLETTVGISRRATVLETTVVQGWANPGGFEPQSLPNFRSKTREEDSA